MMRQAFLYLSHSEGIRRWMESSKLAKGLTRRFVAGTTIETAMIVCRQLYAQRLLSTIDQLGENVTTVSEAIAFRRSIESLYGSIEESGLPLTVSVKPTQLGLDLSTDLCRANTDILARIAAEQGSRLEIDMESHQYVDRTFTLVEQMHSRYGRVRCVLQAYLYRTEDDLKCMNRLGIPVRLCKGAYDEPGAEAFPQKSKVDANYLKLARMLIAEGNFPALATHDPKMIGGVLDAVAKTGRKPGEFEFQMLYGVRRDLQSKLAAKGYGVRLYVPYGDAWYPYFMRRLAERPANVLFLAKNLMRA
jgi:proline dehydrogenase